MVQRGYPSLPTVNNSIRELFRSLKPSYIKNFSRESLPDDARGISWSEPVIATQRLAGLIALNYCLPVTTVIVSFRFDLPVPGRVELSNSSNYFVEIHSEHRSQPDCIQAILAHEIAHIFLHEHRMRLEPQSSNEILTDTTAVYLGCGVLILNGTNDMECYIGYDRVERQQQHFGYLTVDEVGYVLA